MKQALTLSLILGVAAVSLLGFLFMAPRNGHANCIAVTLNGAACPEQDNLGFINFHLNAFKKISLAVLGATALAALLAFSLAILAVSLLNAPSASRRFAFSAKRFARLSELAGYNRRSQTAGWLALHENSPGVF